ncbi:hypothetical protein OH687_03455 [Burkholderia anthina]|nr:hypothetical protein OH687_03455 [Burkholderia anthina]
MKKAAVSKETAAFRIWWRIRDVHGYCPDRFASLLSIDESGSPADAQRRYLHRSSHDLSIIDLKSGNSHGHRYLDVVRDDNLVVRSRYRSEAKESPSLVVPIAIPNAPMC